MPIDFGKILGLEERERDRAADRAVRADVERARQLNELETTARRQRLDEDRAREKADFTSNYAKLMELEGNTEGLGEMAETAWAKRMASADMPKVNTFDAERGKAKGGMSTLGQREVEAGQAKFEADKTESQVKTATNLGKLASAALGPAAGLMVENLLGGEKKKAFELERADTVNRALAQDDMDVIDTLQRRDDATTARRLGNVGAQNQVDLGRQQFFRRDATAPVEDLLQREQLRRLQLNNDLLPAYRESMIEYNKARAGERAGVDVWGDGVWGTSPSDQGDNTTAQQKPRGTPRPLNVR